MVGNALSGTVVHTNTDSCRPENERRSRRRRRRHSVSAAATVRARACGEIHAALRFRGGQVRSARRFARRRRRRLRKRRNRLRATLTTRDVTCSFGFSSSSRRRLWTADPMTDYARHIFSHILLSSTCIFQRQTHGRKRQKHVATLLHYLATAVRHESIRAEWARLREGRSFYSVFSKSNRRYWTRESVVERNCAELLIL